VTQISEAVEKRFTLSSKSAANIGFCASVAGRWSNQQFIAIIFIRARQASLDFCLLPCTFLSLFSSGYGQTEFYSHTCTKPCSLAVILNNIPLLMKSKLQLLCVLTLIAFSSQGQVTDTTKHKDIILKRSFCLLTGYSLGTYSYVDIGFSKNSNTTIGYHPFSSAYFASTEIKLGDKLILGPKIGGWIAGGSSAMVLGLNMIYYTDFDNGSLVLRPEIGFGVDKLKLVYGYNANLTKYRLERINKHLVGLAYCFKLKKLKDKIRKK
jgi:hypothetical protein